MPRRIDVLTLGLSAQSRWNPLYRRFVRRTVERHIALALKALVARHYPDGVVSLPIRELEAAAGRSYESAWTNDGSHYRLRFLPDDRPPDRPRIAWGRRG